MSYNSVSPRIDSLSLAFGQPTPSKREPIRRIRAPKGSLPERAGTRGVTEWAGLWAVTGMITATEIGGFLLLHRAGECGIISLVFFLQGQYVENGSQWDGRRHSFPLQRSYYGRTHRSHCWGRRFESCCGHSRDEPKGSVHVVTPLK